MSFYGHSNSGRAPGSIEMGISPAAVSLAANTAAAEWVGRPRTWASDSFTSTDGAAGWFGPFIILIYYYLRVCLLIFC